MWTLRNFQLKALVRIIILLLIFPAFRGCKEEPHLWKPGSEQQVIGDYIATYPDQYSEFENLVELAGMEALLKIRGPYTLFLPHNEAMMAYYSHKGVSGLEDFSEEFCEELCRNHFVAFSIPSGDIGLGALSHENGLGDFLATEFVGSDIIISKMATIIDRDIFCSNGVIHELDQVLDPITTDIFSVVASDPSFSIFAEGLRLTGLSDTLKIISFPYGSGQARTRFTVLTVADTIYQRYGIHDVDDLIDWCGANPDSITFLENPFYRYMEYHVLHGSHFLSDLNTGVYPILSRDNNVLFTIDTDYKINYDRTTKEYTGFNVPASNNPAKNGPVHAVDDIMPPIPPTPATMFFETTDFFDVKQGDWYLDHFKRFFDGENTFEKVKWRGDFLQYYWHEGGTNTNGDCWAIQQGWWEISITFPKVMKGEYEVILGQPPWYSIADCHVFLDGEATGINYEGESGPQVVARAVFETTSEHTVTIRNTENGMVFWDYVEFIPVE